MALAVPGQERHPPRADPAHRDRPRRASVRRVGNHLGGVVEESVEAGSPDDGDLCFHPRGQDAAALGEEDGEDSEPDEPDDPDDPDEPVDEEDSLLAAGLEDSEDSEDLPFEDEADALDRLSVL
jgi:hypothetical protein